MPGLLQTQEYAEAVMYKTADVNLPPDVVQTRVEIRIARQQLLVQLSAPNFFFVLDEAVVQHLAGARDVARNQIDRLISMARRPNTANCTVLCWTPSRDV